MFLSASSSNIYACMPPNENEVFIARFVSEKELDFQTFKAEKNEKFSIETQNTKFIFQTVWQILITKKSQKMLSAFNLSNFKANDLMIGLAYQSDHNRLNTPYTVLAVSELKCSHNQISLGKAKGEFLAWDRKQKNCKLSNASNISLLDGFLEKNQAYYLQKLKSKYPTCDALEKAFPHSAQSDFYSNFIQRIYTWLF